MAPARSDDIVAPATLLNISKDELHAIIQREVTNATNTYRRQEIGGDTNEIPPSRKASPRGMAEYPENTYKQLQQTVYNKQRNTNFSDIEDLRAKLGTQGRTPARKSLAQPSYRERISTETALHQVTQKIEKALHNKQMALAVYLDISGAFSNTAVQCTQHDKCTSKKRRRAGDNQLD